MEKQKKAFVKIVKVNGGGGELKDNVVVEIARTTYKDKRGLGVKTRINSVLEALEIYMTLMNEANSIKDKLKSSYIDHLKRRGENINPKEAEKMFEDTISNMYNDMFNVENQENNKEEKHKVDYIG